MAFAAQKISSPTDRYHGARARLASLTDQAIFSVASLGIMFVYAHLLSKADFGYYAIVNSICVFSQGAQRAILVLPMVIEIHRHHGGIETVWYTINHILVGACVLIGAAGALLCIVLWPYATLMTFLSGLAVGTYLWFDFARRCHYMMNRQDRALTTSIVYFICTYAILGAIWILGPTLLLAVVGFAAGNLISGIAAYAMVPKGKKGSSLRTVIAEHHATAFWGLASLAPYAVYTSAIPTLTAMLYGAAATGVYSATRILMSPVTTLISAVDNVDKPRASRALASNGLPAMFKSLRNTTESLLVMGLPYLALIVFFPSFMLRYLLGAKYVEDGAVAQVWALVGVFMLLCQPAESVSAVLRMTQNIFVSRVAAALALGVALFLLPIRNPPLHTVSATVAAWLVSIVTTVFLTVRTVQRLETK